ncbi:ribbon-helix-helix domain-containing protein [Clostridium perfringens]|uniref:ribbon-helix-helix domain-containing protein n=1 Tax=Clostridium perfringens TaxID=1502 RepID=UPI002247CB88|nr:ribbon-helix-helix domain-containing protein [Clostridium perfringens]MCX0386658.1 ribbon-helix-helix domain-containing protein [Clostridium perfringens]
MGNPNLKNRVIPNSAIDKELYEKLKSLSKETGIPISRLLDKSIKLLLKENEH